MKPSIKGIYNSELISSQYCGNPGVVKSIDLGMDEANAQSMIQVML